MACVSAPLTLVRCVRGVVDVRAYQAGRSSLFEYFGYSAAEVGSHDCYSARPEHLARRCRSMTDVECYHREARCSVLGRLSQICEVGRPSSVLRMIDFAKAVAAVLRAGQQRPVAEALSARYRRSAVAAGTSCLPLHSLPATDLAVLELCPTPERVLIAVLPS